MGLPWGKLVRSSICKFSYLPNCFPKWRSHPVPLISGQKSRAHCCCTLVQFGWGGRAFLCPPVLVWPCWRDPAGVALLAWPCWHGPAGMALLAWPCWRGPADRPYHWGPAIAGEGSGKVLRELAHVVFLVDIYSCSHGLPRVGHPVNTHLPLSVSTFACILNEANFEGVEFMLSWYIWWNV